MATTAETIGAINAAYDKLGQPVPRHSLAVNRYGDRENLQYFGLASSGSTDKTALTNAIYHDLGVMGRYAAVDEFRGNWQGHDNMVAEYASALIQDSNAYAIFTSGKYDTSGIKSDLRNLGFDDDNIGILTGMTYANRADSLSSRQAFFIANASRAGGGLRSQGTG